MPWEAEDIAATAAVGETPAAEALDDAAFVTKLYNDILLREPDPDSFTFYTQALAMGQPREALEAAFNECPEAFMRALEKRGFSPADFDVVQALADAGKMTPTLKDTVLGAFDSGQVTGANTTTLLRQIANPNGQIDQASTNSCVGATAQTTLAQLSPDQYFLSGAEMAATGSFTLASGALHMVLVSNYDTKTGNLAVVDSAGRNRQVPLGDFVQQVAYANQKVDGGIGNNTGTAATATAPRPAPRRGRG